MSPKARIGRTLALASIVLSSGCVSTARIYNMTDGGVIEAKYTQDGTGRGTIEVPLPSGEVCKGNYLTIANTDTTWGRIYYGVGRSAGFSARTTSDVQHGSAVAVGDRGTTIECEYVLELFKGGYGYCSDNRGRKYRIMF